MTGDFHSIARRCGACLACEAVVSKANDEPGVTFNALLGVERQMSQRRALTEIGCASRCSFAYHGLASEARSRRRRLMSTGLADRGPRRAADLPNAGS